MAGDAANPAQESPTATCFVCTICGDTFKRMEHLSRHQLSHNGTRPFSCPTCSRAFGRRYGETLPRTPEVLSWLTETNLGRDSLARHLMVHQARNGSQTCSDGPGRVARACSQCAKQRLRCDGQDPCARCESKGAQCVYLPRARRRVAPIEGFVLVNAYQNSDDGLPGSSNGGQLMRLAIPKDMSATGQADISNTIVVASDTAAAAVSQADAEVAGPHGDGLGNDVIDPSLEALSRLNALSQAAAKLIPALPNQQLHDQDEHQQDRHGSSSRNDISEDNANNNDRSNSELLVQQSQTPLLPPAEEQSINAILPQLGTIMRLDSTPRDHASFGIDDTGPTPSQSTADFSSVLAIESRTVLSTPQESDLWNVDSLSPYQYDFSVTDWMDTDVPWMESIISPRAPSPFISGSDEHQHADPGLNSGSQRPAAAGSGGEALHHQRQTHARSERALQWPIDWNPTKFDNVVHFPDMSCVEADILEAEDFAHVERMSMENYAEILKLMERQARDEGHLQPLHNGNLASMHALDSFVQLYFEYFHPNLPILHQPTFDPSQTRWQLVLATAAVGCCYSKVQWAVQYATGLQELLRRAIAEAVSSQWHTTPPVLVCDVVLKSSW